MAQYSSWVHGFDSVPDPTHDPEEGVNLDAGKYYEDE
jgi:hypothetical protein